MVDSTSIVHTTGEVINIVNAVIAAVVAIGAFIGGHAHGRNKQAKIMAKK